MVSVLFNSHLFFKMIIFSNFAAQCATNLSIDNGYVLFSGDSKLVAYQCYDGYRLVGSTSAECMQDGTWSSSPPECVGMIRKLCNCLINFATLCFGST